MVGYIPHWSINLLNPKYSCIMLRTVQERLSLREQNRCDEERWVGSPAG